MRTFRALVLTVVAIIAATMVIQSLATRVPSEIALNYVEGFDQIDAARVAQGGSLYGNPNEPPFTVHVYTPLHAFLVSLAHRAGAEGFMPARALGLLAVLGTAVLIVISARRRSGWIAWAVAALYITTPLIGTWGSLGRPDTLAVFLCASGVVLVDRTWKSRMVFVAIPLFLLALLAKQSVAMGLLASMLFLLSQSPRRAIEVGTITCAIGLAAVGLLQWFTDGWFLFHTVIANSAPYSFPKMLELLRQFSVLHWPELIVGLFVLAAWCREKRGTLYVIWFLCSAIATLSLGKSGSDTNHLLEPLTAMAFLIANAWPAKIPGLPNDWARRLAPVALVSVVAIALFNYGIDQKSRAWIEPAEPRFAGVVKRLANLQGPVISDDATILQQLQRPLILRPFVMTQLAYAGNWDEAPVVELLENQEIALVVFEGLPGHSPNRARYTAAMSDALMRNYRRVGSYRTQLPFEIYAPRHKNVLGSLPEAQERPQNVFTDE